MEASRIFAMAASCSGVQALPLVPLSRAIMALIQSVGRGGGAAGADCASKTGRLKAPASATKNTIGQVFREISMTDVITAHGIAGLRPFMRLAV
jgi:hypothetical protein